MITSIVLTHNSRKTIQKTLESIRWCDEILIVDDNSVDDTIAIAKRYPVKIIQHHLENDFAVQRNFALGQAKGNWILFVDSDEVVPDSLQNEIKQKIKESFVAGYYIKRRDYLFNQELKYGETANVQLLRLARKGAGRWTRPVHEVWEINGKTSLLNEPLLHYPHPTVGLFLSDINTYSTRNACYLFNNNVHISCFSVIAYPAGKFIQNYILRLGFLDKTPGVILAIMMSFHSFLTRAKLYLLWSKKK
jgi:glycosyltransferase involved in cell wall biosynthesis